MSNIQSGANGHMSDPRFPQTQEEANEMLIEGLDRDPKRIREEGINAHLNMLRLADKLDGGNTADEFLNSVKPKTEIKEEIKETKQPDIKVVVGDKSSTIDNDIKVTKVEENIVVEPNIPPSSYREVPEGVFIWTPDIWGGKPLHCIPDRVVEKEGRSSMLIMVLVAPAQGRNRQGKVVKLPEGARVAIMVGISLVPVVPLAKGPEGRPVLWICPTTIDTNTNRIRIANPGDKILEFATADGGKEFGLSVMFDPDPKNPEKPRLISLETLRGATGG